MLSVARTGVSNVFREYFSRTASQVSRTDKSRSPNHKPVGIAMNGKQTPKVNLQDWRKKNQWLYSVLTTFLHLTMFSGTSTYWLATKCHPSYTECHRAGISKVLPSTSNFHWTPPFVSTLERRPNNFLFSQASPSPPTLLPLAKSWHILHFLLFVYYNWKFLLPLSELLIFLHAF